MDTAKKVATKVGSAKIQPLQLDAISLNEVVITATGVNAILDLTLDLGIIFKMKTRRLFCNLSLPGLWVLLWTTNEIENV